MHSSVLRSRGCDTIYRYMATISFRSAVSIVLSACLIIAALLIYPGYSSAVGSPACICQMDPKVQNPPFCPTLVCTDTTNGFSTMGHCAAPGICKGESTSGQNGGMGDLSQALGAIKSILDMMKGQQGGGGSGSGDQSSANPNGATPGLGGCAQYYNVTTPSSDPCAVYIPPVSNALSASSSSAAGDLISSLLGGSYVSSNTNTSSATNASTNTNGAQTQTQTQTQVTTQTTTQATSTAAPASLVPGVSGDIQYSSDNVTVLVNNVDTKAGTQVAGFYGTDAGGQPTSVISNMCQGRPWATNFLSFIIPSSFFDSLCELRGYKVGTPAAPAPAVKSVSKPVVTKSPTSAPPAATSTGPYVEPQADIWAVPANVPLGARTTVFWNAKGVTSCQETSPDGSFSQNSLSGGAATVPLSGATTYTISCLTPKGDHITNYVTVNLSAN